jgi:hypothetical protein
VERQIFQPSAGRLDSGRLPEGPYPAFIDSIGEIDMSLVTVVLTLAVVGVLLWLVNRFIPMQGTIKGILNAVVVIAVVLWLLKVFDLYSYLTQFKVGH